MKTLLVIGLALFGMNTYANSSNYEFLPSDCSMSRQQAFELTQMVMNQRSDIAEQFKQENLTKKKMNQMEWLWLIQIKQRM